MKEAEIKDTTSMHPMEEKDSNSHNKAGKEDLEMRFWDMI
jgi:hypothetical protein